MNRKKDPMGRAIADYHQTGKAEKLRVLSPILEEDEIPLQVLFRGFDEMPKIEKTALYMTKGRVLDVGAGAGCHALVLQEQGFDVTAIDISPYAVDTMKERGLKHVMRQDFFSLSAQAPDSQHQYDTVLMLMNGIGIAGTLERMPAFFDQLDKILAPEGQLLCDSSDICYLFMDEDGGMFPPDHPGYYGEMVFQMQYKDTVGVLFPWLYIDPSTLVETASRNGFQAEIITEGEHYDYLARITRKTPAAKNAAHRNIEVVAAIIHDGNGRIFASQRGYGEMKDGWEFPGGKMEKGETREDALKREIMEELDVSIGIERFIKTVDCDYPQFHLTMHCYLCRIKDGHMVLKEHEAARWLSSAEIMSVDWLPADKAVIASEEWQRVFPL